MAWQLFRVGRWSFRHRRTVAGAWVLLLVALAAGAATLSGPTDDSFEVSGIESTRAFGLIEERNPQATPDGATARLVFEAPGGQRLTDPSNRRVVTATLERLRTGDVQSVVDPFTVGTLSKDGRVAYATVGYTESAVDLAAADKDALAAAVRSAEDAGLRVAVGGDALQAETGPPTGEAVGVAVAIVVLTLTFGSLVAAGMPLLTALLGVGIGMTHDHHADRLPPAQLDHPRPGHDARARGGDRLRAVHHVPLPARGPPGTRSGGGRRTCGRSRREVRSCSPD